jgi:hypothetical protein
MDTNEHNIDNFAEIRARVNEIECELFAPEAYTQCNVILPDGPELDRARSLRFEALGRERAELLGRLPPTGMRAGRIVFAKTLGTINLNDWPDIEPETDSATGPIDEWAWCDP